MKTKGIAETILIFTAIVVCTTDGGAHCAKQTSQAAPGTSTGTAIGTAIKTAIGVAFPAISQVISAIWPNNSSGNKNKTQAADAIKTMQDQSVAALKQISSITTDLDTITLFLSNSVVAEDRVIAVRTILKGKSTLSADDKLQIQRNWAEAKGRLARLSGASGSINNMTDRYSRATLHALVDANAGLLDAIKADMDAGDAGLASLSDDLSTLSSQLSAANGLATEIVGDISNGLKGVKITAAGGMGSVPISDEVKNNNAEMEKILKTRLPKLTTYLSPGN